MKIISVVAPICLLAVACSQATKQTRTLTKKEDEDVMLIAIHHNRDEVFANMNSLTDQSWTYTPEGLANLDSSLAITTEHNKKYPATPWEQEGLYILKRHPQTKERIDAAQKRMESMLRDARAEFDGHLEKVEACTKLYRATIDKKQADLTVRESQEIKTCQALDLYRLDVSAKR